MPGGWGGWPPKATHTKQRGADYNLFCTEWEKDLRAHPDIEVYEFWNEPWIFDWTWADTGEEYRKLQKQWCEMALKVNPKLRIVAGNSFMFTQDHIQPWPDCYKGLLSGTSHHPYSDNEGATWRSGANNRSIDGGTMVTHEMGLPCYYITEGGTRYGGSGRENNIVNARRVVQYFVRSALAGAFQGDMQWGIGYGPEWTRSNTTFAFLTYMTEDRPVLAEVWPENELLWGAIFANPKFLTDEPRKAPRAKDMGARWNVAVPADRADDKTKVAVVWCLTGLSNDQVDTAGTLTIADASDLKAFDMTGQPIAAKGGQLVLPFNENPVYITTEKLTVADLKARVAGGKVEKVTPLNMYALSLLQPADQAQKLLVRVENQMNVQIKGTLSLVILGADKTVKTDFAIPAAKLVEVPIDWPAAKLSDTNQYPIVLTAAVTGGASGKVVQSQIIDSALFARKTITVDGKLSDWAGIKPVVMNSQARVDLTKYALNPNLKPTGEEGGRAVAKVYTAYDDQFVYIALQGWGHRTTIGAAAPNRPAQFKNGEPSGLNYVANCGDVMQLGFGVRDRVPGHGRQMDDPWAWKGLFYDTDYQYAVYKTADGKDVLMRLWGPDTGRQTPYQTDVVPWAQPVEGAKVVITDECYEVAIPRAELKLFDSSKDRLRFGFVLNGRFSWASSAGVFDHWYNLASFGPSWANQLPCQTFFGIGKM